MIVSYLNFYMKCFDTYRNKYFQSALFALCPFLCLVETYDKALRISTILSYY